MASADELATAEDAYCFADPGKVYVCYLPTGGSTGLGIGSGTYSVAWFNPRSGGELQGGTVEGVTGPGIRSIGEPPEDPERDWVVLLRRAAGETPRITSETKPGRASSR
jgi:hypothetical protein